MSNSRLSHNIVGFQKMATDKKNDNFIEFKGHLIHCVLWMKWTLYSIKLFFFLVSGQFLKSDNAMR